MLGSSGGLEGNPTPEPSGEEVLGGGSDFFEGDRSTGGNRWPRQETLALLKIRSDMDGVFRDSSSKGPMWEEVSRKMADLGFHRNSKKCKEKFENVYKYHKRTKDRRVGKSDGKTYRFFDQLEALEQHHSSPLSLPPLPPVTPRAQPQSLAQNAIPVRMVIPAGTNQAVPTGVTVTSSAHPISIATNTTPEQAEQTHLNEYHNPVLLHHSNPIQMENGSSPSDTLSSSSTSSDEEALGRKNKRKWKDFFEVMMKEVIDKQEKFQKRFLKAVEKREHDRLVHEEAWKVQEMSRLNREHEILVRGRSMAAAKDAALIELLKKISDQHQIQLPVLVQTQNQAPAAVPIASCTVVTSIPPQPQSKSRQEPISQLHPQVSQVHVQEIPVSLAVPAPAPAPALALAPAPTATLSAAPAQPKPLTQIPPQQKPLTLIPPQQKPLIQIPMNATEVDINESNNSGGESHPQTSSSRWPKSEVEALINLRTKLDEKYQENCPKGPLWEEISSSMKQLGYNRNAKRCKEKWENINKYFKKVKESNKKRPEDSKTCPYFHQLDALYRKKMGPITVQLKPENFNTMSPIIAQPELQWGHSGGSDNYSGEDDGNEEADEDNETGYEIVTNNNNNNNLISTSTTVTTSL